MSKLIISSNSLGALVSVFTSSQLVPFFDDWILYFVALRRSHFKVTEAISLAVPKSKLIHLSSSWLAVLAQRVFIFSSTTLAGPKLVVSEPLATAVAPTAKFS